MTTNELRALADTLTEALTTLRHMCVHLPDNMISRPATRALIDRLADQQGVIIRQIHANTIPAGWTQHTLTGA